MENNSTAYDSYIDLVGLGPSLTVTNSKQFSINLGGSNKFIQEHSGRTNLAHLAGSGTRMVVADSSGWLSTQEIPEGGSGEEGSDDQDWTRSGSA